MHALAYFQRISSPPSTSCWGGKQQESHCWVWLHMIALLTGSQNLIYFGSSTLCSRSSAQLVVQEKVTSLRCFRNFEFHLKLELQLNILRYQDQEISNLYVHFETDYVGRAFCCLFPTISWPMIHHLLTISGYAATLVIPWREFWAENTSGDDKPGIFWPKFGHIKALNPPVSHHWVQI